MKLRKILLFIAILLAVSANCLGQDYNPEENWLKEYQIYNEPLINFRYDRYSKKDLLKFREKLDLLKGAKFEEWEGTYISDFPDEVGVSQFRWESDIGFVSFYVYSCLPELRYLNYGKIIDSPDSIQLVPELAENSPRKLSKTIKYIKIKWGDIQYLVEEASLPAFAEKVVGIYVEPDNTENDNYQKWSNYWVSGSSEKEQIGLPEFPANYKKFQRFPIGARIIKIGKRRLEKEISVGNMTYSAESAIYPITLDAGKNKGVKIGMFFVTPIGEEIFITHVRQNKSSGIVIRPIDDEKMDKPDHYLDDDNKQIACPKIKVFSKVKTRVGHFWF